MWKKKNTWGSRHNTSVVSQASATAALPMVLPCWCYFFHCCLVVIERIKAFFVKEKEKELT